MDNIRRRGTVLLEEKLSPLSRAVERGCEVVRSLGFEGRAQVMAGGQQDGAVELDSEDGMRSSGEKGWQSVPAPTAHCKHTNTPWVRVASSLGALGAWIPRGGTYCLDFPGWQAAIADLCRP